MPQLPKDVAKRTETAERTSWDIEDGLYVVELTSVDDKDPKTKKAYSGDKGPYWRWNVKLSTGEENGGKYKGRELNRAISLSEGADGMRQEAYIAFGDPTCSVNTDTLIGNKGLAEIKNKPGNKDPNKLFPEIVGFYPLDSEAATANGGADKGSENDEENF